MPAGLLRLAMHFCSADITAVPLCEQVVEMSRGYRLTSLDCFPGPANVIAAEQSSSISPEPANVTAAARSVVA